MEKGSLDWFERRRRTKGLELAHDQIVKALDTIVLLNKAVHSYSEGEMTEVKQLVELFLQPKKKLTD